MWFPFSTIIIIICTDTFSYSKTSKPEIKLISAPVGDRVVLSCGNEDNEYRVYDWFENKKPLEFAAHQLTKHSNGSIDFRLRMENADRIFSCQSYNSYPNGTNGSLLIFVYSFLPIVKAFLAKTVYNTTVDWGAIYRFPCIFGGTDPRVDTMILNNKVVTEMEHNITEDSVVECKVQNSLGMVHDFAYIKVRPDSEAWGIKYGVSIRHPSCHSYSTILPKSSVCYPFIENIANQNKEPYLISRSRIYSSELSNQAIENLFSSWDEFLSSSSSSMHVFRPSNHSKNSEIYNSSVIESSYNVVDTINSSIGNAAWRCVNLAKHLTCAVSYPQCGILDSNRKSASVSSTPYFEYPVCLKHCLAVTGLFCFSSLKTSNNSALDSLLGLIFHSESLIASHFMKTGWSELINVPEARSQYLPLSFSHPLINGTSHPFYVCSPTNSYVISSEPSTKSLCTRLPIDHANAPNLTEKKLKTVSGQNIDCFTGNGESYMGLGTMPECVPWANLVVRDENIQNLQPGIWPGLYGLNDFTFPKSLSNEASSSAVCRNPSGLASKPFCLSRKDNKDKFQNVSSTPHLQRTHHLEEWYLTSCYKIPLCSEITDNTSSRKWTVGSGSPGALEITEAQSQHTSVHIIIACSTVGLALCFLIISCIICLINRYYGKNIGNSVVHFPEFDFHISEIQKDKISVNDESDESRRFSQHLYDTTGTSEVKYLERRRKSLTRRRRLRQLNPCFQCIFGLYYRIFDLIHSSHATVQLKSGFAATQCIDDNYLLSVPNQTAMTNVWHSRYLSSLCPCFHIPHLLKKPKHDSLKMVQSAHNYPVARKETVDEEFEANTIRMQMDRSVVYLTNAPTVISPPKSLDSSSNICVSCGVSSNLLSNACLSCSIQNNPGGVSSSTTADHHIIDSGSHSHNHVSSDHEDDDSWFVPALGLAESCYQSLSSGSAELCSSILTEKLVNMASMIHLLHPKLKSLCFPRSRLVEIRCLARCGFGWVILVHAPNLNKLVHRRRLLSLTTSERLRLISTSSQEDENNPNGHPSPDESNDCIAVVKMIQGGINLEAEVNFLREAEILIELQHKNIIQLLGVCIPLEPLSLIIEYMPFGDFHSFLRHYANGSSSCNSVVVTANGEVLNAHSLPQTSSFCKTDFAEEYPNKLDVKMLIEMAIDACEAMIYLSEAYYVHRDVATRSFLVGKELIVKLSDLSMCRPIEPDVDFISAYDECLPIKWLPLESILEGRFHTDTDVWSFGVLLWEVFSYAVEPYTDQSHKDVIEALERGDCLKRPFSCPESVYQLMLKCWSADRTERPKFNYIGNCLKEICTDLKVV
ncbi:Muscle, skeletal receptor tyrosine-protein kinase [Schistosoma japonicum]|nr:Muscle, skeletal receptor tyrosine-protein kinase [Schistosoma japonicum]